ncbi:hypothetical protein Tco_0614110, partial [Tanacetum coccineum]
MVNEVVVMDEVVMDEVVMDEVNEVCNGVQLVVLSLHLDSQLPLP